MNFHQILEWVKTNLVIVIFIVVMVAAPIAMYIVAGGMNAKVKEEVNKRASSITQLTTLTVESPAGGQMVPTEILLQTYEQATKSLADDAAAVQKRAVDFNRKGRGVLMPEVFPEPAFEVREIIPKRFHERLVTAYDQLLTDVHGGSPPALEELRKELESKRDRFISQDLKKDPSAKLEPDEAERLKKMLSDARIEMYTQAAARVGLYVAKDGLYVPAWDQSRIPSASDMFVWQWQYWAVEDVLKAVASANKDATSVASAPVKQVLGIVVQGLPKVAGASTESGGGGPPRLSGGFGAEGTGGGASPPAGAEGGDGAAPAGGGEMADAKAPLKPDYSTSFAGLAKNALFDVLTIDFAIVAETARLPEILDAISRYNFNTITNLRVEVADAFAATERGFYFGPEPVCTVTLQMQTVWLREWTKPFMPPQTRTELGVPPDAPAPPAAPDAPPAPG